MHIIGFLMVACLARIAAAYSDTCSMKPGLPLAQCLGFNGKGCDYPEYKRCTQLDTLRKKADCYCSFFQKQADCWGRGICCTEYPAHAAAANDICRYAKHKNLKPSTLKSKAVRAYGVVMQVCHNDCGWDIPCLPDEPEPKNGQNPNGRCQPRSYWTNGVCQRKKC